MSMTEKEIQELYSRWDNNPNILKASIGLEVHRKWYQKLWTRVKLFFI